MFNPACLWCGARHIQYIQRVLVISRDAKAKECRGVLERWMELGHSETQLRNLAKQADYQVAPPGLAMKKKA